jgi:hypothetical protein
MKTARRHELQHNDLADWIASSIESVRPYSKMLAAGLVAVAVLGLAYWYLAQESQKKQAQAWTEYYNARATGDADALTKLLAENEGTPVALWARLYIADSQLLNGIEGLFRDRAAAVERLRRAADNYRVIRDTSTDPVLTERAMLGLARAYEALPDKLADAQLEYQALLDRNPQGIFAAQARARGAELERVPVREFHDWFAAQEIKPPAAPQSPDIKPTFDAEGLPDRSDFSLPDSTSPETAPTEGAPTTEVPMTPETTAPEATAPESAAPESPTPENAAPETAPTTPEPTTSNPTEPQEAGNP